MSYRPITDQEARDYPWRILLEHICDNCGEGFASIKAAPRFCSSTCRIEFTRDELGARSRQLWSDPRFRSRIQAARRAAGYPDSSRPEAVARRKVRQAAKNAIARTLRARGTTKQGATAELLGYHPSELVAHLERQFVDGMTWANYGDWEVDHIRPIASFALIATVAEVNALDNLRPLWKPDNRRKRDRGEL